MHKVRVQFVDADGCYVMYGIRVRCAPGCCELTGSLVQEMAHGTVTPLAPEGPDQLLPLVADLETAAFVRSLPVMKLRPRSSKNED